MTRLTKAERLGDAAKFGVYTVMAVIGAGFVVGIVCLIAGIDPAGEGPVLSSIFLGGMLLGWVLNSDD